MEIHPFPDVQFWGLQPSLQ